MWWKFKKRKKIKRWVKLFTYFFVLIECFTMDYRYILFCTIWWSFCTIWWSSFCTISHHPLPFVCRGVHRVTDLEKFPVRISKMKLSSTAYMSDSLSHTRMVTTDIWKKPCGITFLVSNNTHQLWVTKKLFCTICPSLCVHEIKYIMSSFRLLPISLTNYK